ncbi:MAG TPA: tetratricopeptide repeat protein [Blastocatellia bacterium]|nr:tetratricopeptide repeat protein [Blastocatellia bacterium]
MAKQVNHLYEFGSVTLDATNRLLYRDGKQLSIQPRVIDTLLVLVENAHAVVDKETILETVWPGMVVEEGGLKRNISLLRKALGEEGRFIETLPKRGYRFTAEVRERWEENPVIITQAEASELEVERRVNLRITHEEEITDSSNAFGAVPLDEKSIEVTRVSRSVPTSSLRRQTILVVSLVAFAVIGLFVYWRVAGSPKLPATSAEVESMAVLPFKTIGAKPEDNYLGLGLADVLITQLGRMRQIVIRPIGAVQKYAETDHHDPLAAGRDLGVETVLEGSVQHAGDNLRVTVRLLRVGDGVLLWSGKFDEKFTDIFSLQDSLSQQVAEALVLNLSREQRELLKRRYTNSVEAYQLYLKGRYFWNRRATAGLRRSVEYFGQAIEVDPTYALAYAGLADSYALLVWQNELLQQEFLPKAKAAAARALEIDETLGEAHTSLGFIKLWYEWDFAGAESEYRRAIELKPDYATAHHWLGELLVLMGRFDEGFKELTSAQRGDPLSLIINADIGKMHFFTRQPDLAIEQLKKTVEMDPHFPNVKLFLAMAYNQRGMVDEAIAELQEVADRPESRTLFKAVLGYIYAKAGRTSEAMTILNVLKEGRPGRSAPAFDIALVYTGLGDVDQAFEWLEKARAERNPFLVYVKMDPHFDLLRADPRFADLLRRVGFAT